MEEPKKDYTLLWNAIIIITVGAILTSGYLIYSEYSDSKKSCEETEGEFEFNFPSEYLCDEQPWIKYTDGWSYEKEKGYDGEINLTNYFLP